MAWRARILHRGQPKTSDALESLKYRLTLLSYMDSDIGRAVSLLGLFERSSCSTTNNVRLRRSSFLLSCRARANYGGVLQHDSAALASLHVLQGCFHDEQIPFYRSTTIFNRTH
jgi:hypothetical protein